MRLDVRHDWDRELEQQRDFLLASPPSFLLLSPAPAFFILASAELHLASFRSTEEKHMPADSELDFSRTWIQRETRSIFTPNISIKPKMKEIIISVVFAGSCGRWLYWFLCLEQPHLPCPAHMPEVGAAAFLKYKHCKGFQSFLGQQGTSLDFFHINNCFPEFDIRPSGNREGGYIYYLSFFFNREGSRLSEMMILIQFCTAVKCWSSLSMSLCTTKSKFKIQSLVPVFPTLENPNAVENMMWRWGSRSPDFWSCYKMFLCIYKEFKHTLFCQPRLQNLTVLPP